MGKFLRFSFIDYFKFAINSQIFYIFGYNRNRTFFGAFWMVLLGALRFSLFFSLHSMMYPKKRDLFTLHRKISKENNRFRVDACCLFKICTSDREEAYLTQIRRDLKCVIASFLHRYTNNTACSRFYLFDCFQLHLSRLCRVWIQKKSPTRKKWPLFMNGLFCPYFQIQ